MTGWTAVDCEESDRIRYDNSVSPASSLTDPEGVYSSGVIFTEWWTRDERPLLRDYRYSDDRPCTHYVPSDETAVLHDDDRMTTTHPTDATHDEESR